MEEFFMPIYRESHYPDWRHHRFGAKDRLDLAWHIEAGKRLNDGECSTAAGIKKSPKSGFPFAACRPRYDKDWLDLRARFIRISTTKRGIVITHGTNTTLDRLLKFARNRQTGGVWLHALLGDQRGWLFELVNVSLPPIQIPWGAAACW
jgi:hypothetical protein